MSRSMIVVTPQNHEAIDKILPIQIAVGDQITWGNDTSLGHFVDAIRPDDDWPYWETEDGPSETPTHVGYLMAVKLLGSHEPRRVSTSTAFEMGVRLTLLKEHLETAKDLQAPVWAIKMPDGTTRFVQE